MRIIDSVPAALALSAIIAISACGSDPAEPTTADPDITTTSLPAGMLGVPYAASVSASGGGGEYEWSISGGSLPPGLGLEPDDMSSDLIITGIPEAAGDFEFDLRVEVPDGRTDVQHLAIGIGEPEPFGIENAALAPALVGYGYGVQLEAAAQGTAEVTWSIVEGSLPAGITLSSSGRFSGSPTMAGTYEIVIRASTPEESVQESFMLVVNEEDTSRFNLTVLPAVPIPAQLQDNVAEAVRRWEAAIVGDIPRFDAAEGDLDLRDRSSGMCAGFTHLADGTSIDDMIIIVNIGPIDEGGSLKPTEDGDSVFTNTIGSASPCFIRSSGDGVAVGDLPIVGVLTLDEFDLFNLEEDSQELATDLIQHEIAHILGLGSLWGMFSLLEGSGTDDPLYVGEQGVVEYKAAGGTRAAIPVENEGPPGTREGHWRESVFNDELMTGSLKRTSYLSAMSIASFADFGYEVDTSAAEGPLVIGILGMEQDPFELWLHGDVKTETLVGIRPDGTRTIIISPSNLR
ncbi:MAG: putative Ig domain-containing protein [Gemmatimonadales bacterium]